jgi:hypothetical protein
VLSKFENGGLSSLQQVTLIQIAYVYAGRQELPDMKQFDHTREAVTIILITVVHISDSMDLKKWGT